MRRRVREPDVVVRLGGKWKRRRHTIDPGLVNVFGRDMERRLGPGVGRRIRFVRDTVQIVTN